MVYELYTVLLMTRTTILAALLLTATTTATGCLVGSGGDADSKSAPSQPSQPSLTASAKMPKYTGIRDAASARGMRNAYLLAGIANDETGLAMCWSEATWACQGPSSPDCGGGPVIAGSADGPCSDAAGRARHVPVRRRHVHRHDRTRTATTSLTVAGQTRRRDRLRD